MSMVDLKNQLELEGNSLYRFEPDCCHRIEALQEGKFYISDPKNFNDPLDLRLSIKDFSHRSLDEDKFKKIVKFIYEEKLFDKFYIFNDEIIRKIISWSQDDSIEDLTAIIEIVKERILNFGVQCFSLGYNIPLQWSHYSNSHKGFCIEYNVRSMDLVKKNEGFACYQVTYINKLPEICISEALFTPHQVMEKLLATKTLEWAYEQEIRIINFEKQGQLVDMPIGLSIKSLIAGANMKPKHLKLLKQTGEKLGVPVYQMKRGKNDFDPLWSREEL